VEYGIDHIGLSITCASADLVAGDKLLHPAAPPAFASLIPISHNPLTLRDMASPGLPV
jgi:hypothetical protein